MVGLICHLRIWQGFHRTGNSIYNCAYLCKDHSEVDLILMTKTKEQQEIKVPSPSTATPSLLQLQSQYRSRLCRNLNLSIIRKNNFLNYFWHILGKHFPCSNKSNSNGTTQTWPIVKMWVFQPMRKRVHNPRARDSMGCLQPHHSPLPRPTSWASGKSTVPSTTT